MIKNFVCIMFNGRGDLMGYNGIMTENPMANDDFAHD